MITVIVPWRVSVRLVMAVLGTRRAPETVEFNVWMATVTVPSMVSVILVLKIGRAPETVELIVWIITSVEVVIDSVVIDIPTPPLDAKGTPVSVETGWKSVTPDSEGPGARRTMGVIHTALVPDSHARHCIAVPLMVVSRANWVTADGVIKEDVLPNTSMRLPVTEPGRFCLSHKTWWSSWTMPGGTPWLPVSDLGERIGGTP